MLAITQIQTLLLSNVIRANAREYIVACNKVISTTSCTIIPKYINLECQTRSKKYHRSYLGSVLIAIGQILDLKQDVGAVRSGKVGAILRNKIELFLLIVIFKSC